MVNKVKFYHSYTRSERYLIKDMHPSHIVNALAVINEGRHAKYYVGDPVYLALIGALLETTVTRNSRKRGMAKKPVKRSGYGQTYPSLSKLREVAKAIIRTRGYVAADSLRSFMLRNGYRGLIGSDFCPVFRVKDFLPIGRKPSNWPSANGREIRVYILA
jgi:hypothetical protein